MDARDPPEGTAITPEPSAAPDGVLPRPWAKAVDMLRAVVNGGTYDAVGRANGITRTAVERRIKQVAVHLVANAGVAGLNSDAAAFVSRLRAHREDVLTALDAMGTAEPVIKRGIYILSDQEIHLGALRIRGRSPRPLEDLALYYLLLATGARTLEIARLEVRDYLHADGSVRCCSEMRAEAAITGRARPLYFRSAHLHQAMDAYLADRAERSVRAGDGVAGTAAYRGLEPGSRLFLSSTGQGFEIKLYGASGQRRYLCRAIQEVYRKLFRYAEFKQITALTARHTTVDRLYARGADEDQVGLLLGIAERSTVREHFPRRLQTLDALTDDLV